MLQPSLVLPRLGRDLAGDRFEHLRRQVAKDSDACEREHDREQLGADAAGAVSRPVSVAVTAVR